MADGEGLDAKVGAQLAGESPESSLWFAWKRAHELVRAAVIEEVTAATGLSDPDVGILLRLDVVGGSLRQSEIASALGWDRTRLSHQLTRMEERGLLARRRTPSGVWVEISDAGQRAATAARNPVHAAAFRRHLAERFDPRAGPLHASQKITGAACRALRSSHAGRSLHVDFSTLEELVLI